MSQQMKIPPAWQPDEWVCHHTNSRQSYLRSAATSRNFDSSPPPKRISTAKLRRQIENLSLKSAEYRLSARKSKIKRLTDTATPISYKSFFSYASRHIPTPPIRIPKMSKQAFKRWLDARDAYLGRNYPYVLEHPRRRRRRKTESSNKTNKLIDDDEAVSILSFGSDCFTVPELMSPEKQRRLSRRDSHMKSISQSETNVCRSGRRLFQRIKSFVQSPVTSLSCGSLRKQPKKTEIIRDNFDDKYIGTEISERTTLRSNIQQHDQAIQVNLPRPQIQLHHEYDTSMVEGERLRRIRSVRRYVEYRDKATETDFILNFANVEKERREEKEVCVDEDDKATRRDIEEEKIDPYNEQYNVEQHQLPSMSESNQRKTKKKQQPEHSTNTIEHRIIPLTNLFETSNDRDKHNGSRATILSATESNLSVHEQLHRLRIRFNRLSKERRLLAYLLTIFAVIMCGLLVGIFILSWVFQGRTPVIYRDMNSTHTGTSDGVLQQNERRTSTRIIHINTILTTKIIPTALLTATIQLTTSTKKQLARYGEACESDSHCEQPFICYKKGSTAPGMCRCPLKYDLVKDQCIGDLNALCTKDTDCQRYMTCSGMNDGTRQCQCQAQFNYDKERRRCRGDYQAPCEDTIDCRANLVCNKTTLPSVCSCELHYQYYSLLRKCRGDPGAVCDQPTAECADNAECRDGACECSNQYVPDENKICVDPCPAQISSQARIRYPGNCRRFIDCQQKLKIECPEMTIFNLRTQLCDYPKNVFDCR